MSSQIEFNILLTLVFKCQISKFVPLNVVIVKGILGLMTDSVKCYHFFNIVTYFEMLILNCLYEIKYSVLNLCLKSKLVAQKLKKGNDYSVIQQYISTEQYFLNVLIYSLQSLRLASFLIRFYMLSFFFPEF